MASGTFRGGRNDIPDLNPVYHESELFHLPYNITKLAWQNGAVVQRVSARLQRLKKGEAYFRQCFGPFISSMKLNSRIRMESMTTFMI